MIYPLFISAELTKVLLSETLRETDLDTSFLLDP